MFKFLSKQYALDDLSEVKISKKVIRVNTNKGKYIIKQVDDDSLDKLFLRLSLMHLTSFALPLRGRNNLFVQEEDDKYYLVYNYYPDESLLGYDLKLSFYLKQIATLHANTYLSLNANDHFLESTLNYLDEQIKHLSDALLARVEVIERNDYHSPNDWYFLMNYQKYASSLEEASRHVLNLENIVKENKGLRLALTYQNFDFSHILLKQEKIISPEKMAYNFAPVDLVNLISNLKLESLDIIPFIEEYLKINPLNDYEKEYLMASLYIFEYHRYNDTLEDLNHLISISKYLDKVISLSNDVIFSSSSQE